MKIFPVFIPHQGCAFKCIYCNQHSITRSKLPDIEKLEPAIVAFCRKNRSEEKEIAFFGGTFTNMTKPSQQKYLDIANKFWKHISGIRISTRPDSIDPEVLTFCKENNVRTIELGIQSFDDEVLKKSFRGYNSETAINACKLVKGHKFQLGIQLMPGLPGFCRRSMENSIDLTKKISPHFVRIYPTIILKKTKLEKWFLAGKYTPLKFNKAVEMVSGMLREFEQNGIQVIKIGLHSDIKEEDIVAGPYHRSFGELVRAEILKKNILENYKPQTLVISSLDISLFKGFKSQMLKALKQELKLDKFPIIIDSKMEKSKFLFTELPPLEYW
jgi:histone acetyltransferase (RNA polymerase elongator complex component)